MEPECLLLHSQVPATCLYTEPAESIPYSRILPPADPYYPAIYTWVSQWFPSLRFPHQNPVYLSYIPTRATCPTHLIIFNGYPFKFRRRHVQDRHISRWCYNTIRVKLSSKSRRITQPASYMADES
jgi:hypothetical protein